MDIEGVYLSWYNLALKALSYEVVGSVSRGVFSNVVLTGMGGSGIVGDVIYSLACRSSDVPFTVVKDFRLPKWVGRNSLVCVISYSGNTVETLNAALDALNANAEVAVVSSGGKLVELAKSKGIPYVRVDGGLVPRAAFPTLLIATLKILSNYGIKLSNDLSMSIEVLRSVDDVRTVSKELATFIKDYLPVIIANTTFSPLAIRFKNELNENSKIMAKVETLPEWAHNDIVGWEGWLSVVKAVIIWDEDSVVKFANDFLRGLGVPTYVLKLRGDDYLAKVLYGSLVAGLTSVYLAGLRGVNAEETKSIETYKKFISRVSPT